MFKGIVARVIPRRACTNTHAVMKKLLVLAFLVGLIIIGCSRKSTDINYVIARQKAEIPTDTQYLPIDGPKPPARVSLAQGWPDEKRSAFWFTPQGAHVMPYRWFAALEQPANKKLFRNATHMADLGYLPMDSSLQNPAALPIGFAMSRAKTQKEAYMGFTCAACHVNQIEYKDKIMLIDGAPTLGNFVRFFDQAVASLNNTYSDEEKFTRFAKRVLGDEYSVSMASALKVELKEAADAASLRQLVNSVPDHYPKDFTSFGRLDAFTNIENAGAAFALGMPTNGNPAIAPVSYPFLWGTHQSDVVQWNGSAPNKPRLLGPMVRNIGQVVGVFGGLTITPKEDGDVLAHHYESTIDFEGLGILEGLVKNLRSPRWDDPNANLPAPDSDKVAVGKVLYAEHCASCHQVIAPEDEGNFYDAVMTPVDGELMTDPMTAWAAEHNLASSGILEGSKSNIVAGKPLADTVPAINISVNGVVGLMLEYPGKIIKDAFITQRAKLEKNWDALVRAHAENRDSIYQDKHDDHQLNGLLSSPEDATTTRNLKGLKYKARPLNGIWATAPYLHNGSVPNLWSLLLPPEERPETFWVGSHKFDPKRVGFVTSRGKSRFRVKGKDGKITEGNSNLGHPWGTMLSEADRWALVEYMKTL